MTKWFADQAGRLSTVTAGRPDYGAVVRTLGRGTSDRGTSLDHLRAFPPLDSEISMPALGGVIALD